MLDKQNLNDLANKLSSVLPESVKTLKTDVEKNIKATLESSLRQMNLVGREEFDVQSALLERTLLKIKQLEQQIQELENK
ncbi:hypothetical protein MNBD_GAMMA09-546 [hydrothermal vent metagenome]|uniref:Ubiquinone biosynthesis accessory factor UbiK n=1 Tax=hydrothermal vent metagenome TaxID=652676 RepID=A0A3B0XJ51_9ZZZZ